MSENRFKDDDNSKNGDFVISKKKLAVIIIIIIILLLLICGLIVWLISNGNNAKETSTDDVASTVTVTTSEGSKITADIDPNVRDYTGETSRESKETSSKGIQVPGYASITIPADTTEVTMSLFNPESNSVYFTFEIILDETGETIYQSKMVPPGKALTDITLTRALSAGTYDATIRITTNSIEDLSPKNGADVKTELIVK